MQVPFSNFCLPKFPLCIFPLITLCWLESDLIHKDICWQGQDKMAEFLSAHVTEHLILWLLFNQGSLEDFVNSETGQLMAFEHIHLSC